MIELTILELLYLVLIFFIVVLWTLATLVLCRILKILSVGVEIAGYYWQFKKLCLYYSRVPLAIKEKVSEMISERGDEEVRDTQKTSN